MKKNIGAVNALYPTPVVLVGSESDGVANYINIAHVGILDPSTMSLSMNRVHHSNSTIRANKTLSINIPSNEMVIKTDYVGIVSGAKTDKSDVFENFYGQLKGAPMIIEAPISMECEVVDILDLKNHDVFIVKVVNTFVNEEVLDGNSVDLTKVKPLLFDMHKRKYWSLGDPIAKCWNVGKEYK